MPFLSGSKETAIRAHEAASAGERHLKFATYKCQPIAVPIPMTLLEMASERNVRAAAKRREISSPQPLAIGLRMNTTNARKEGIAANANPIA